MTKPWEETWTILETSHTTDVVFPDGHAAEIGALRVDDARDPSEQDRQRARLAAQAPAMARLLLDLEWGGMVQDEECCPSCYARPRKGHDTDCELVSVLRAAGVID